MGKAEHTHRHTHTHTHTFSLSLSGPVSRPLFLSLVPCCVTMPLFYLFSSVLCVLMTSLCVRVFHVCKCVCMCTYCVCGGVCVFEYMCFHTCIYVCVYV